MSLKVPPVWVPRTTYDDQWIADPHMRTSTKVRMNIPQADKHLPQKVDEKLCKVQIEKFDASKMQWTRWQEQFELQMLANDVPEDSWVKLVSFHLDDRAYKAYKQWTSKVTGNQLITWNELATLMEHHFQKEMTQT